MDRLTPEQLIFRLDVWRKLHSHWLPDEADRQLMDLREHLQSLSQEAVREEVLENVLGIAGMLEFQAKLALDHGESDIKLDAKVIVPKIVESLRALKREPNAAGQVGGRETSKDELTKQPPAPAAPSSSPGIPSDGTIYEGTAPQGASALNEMEGSTLTHAVAAAPVAEMVKRLRDYRCADPWAGALMIEAAALLAKLGHGWIPPETVLEIDEDGKAHPEGVNLKNLRPGASDD